MNLKIILILAVLLAGCSRSFDSKIMNRVQERANLVANEELAAQPQIQITSLDGVPISGATVYIGVSGLSFNTDADGKINVPNEWVSEDVVTIEAAGFMRTSYVGEAPGTRSYKIATLPNANPFELKGKTTGYKNLKQDGFADFAMVMKTINRAETLHFNISDLVSPESDKIDIMGNEVNLPSNISLPKQTESYLFFPINLAKEKYRYYFNDLGKQNLYIAQARMNFKNSVAKMMGKEPSYKLINEFNFIGGTLKTLDIIPVMPELDFNVGEFVFNTKSTFNMPAGSAAEPEIIIAGTLAQRAGKMIPLDFKWAQKKTVQLNTLPGDQMHLVAVKKKEKDMQEPLPRTSPTTAYLVGADSTSTMNFMPFVKAPKILKDGSDVLTVETELPKLSGETSEQGMMVSLEQVDTIVVNEEKIKLNVNKYWEIYSRNWKNKILLPNLAPLILGQQRVTVNFLSSMEPQILSESRMMMIQATHLTSNSAEY